MMPTAQVVQCEKVYFLMCDPERFEFKAYWNKNCNTSSAKNPANIRPKYLNHEGRQIDISVLLSTKGHLQ